MPNYRDFVRTGGAAGAARARLQGVIVDDIRKESRGVQATGAMVSRFVNESTPTTGRDRIVAVDFAGQTYDGTNTEFTLDRSVFGQNLVFWRIEQSTGTAIPLVRTTNPAPAGNQFWFDGAFTIRVGTAPQPADGLLGAIVSPL